MGVFSATLHHLIAKCPLVSMLVVQPRQPENNLMYFQEPSAYMSPTPAPQSNNVNQQQNFGSGSRTNQQWQPTRSNQICRYWAKDGKCPNKRCPYSSTHTAQTSPRYAKHMPQAQREGALEIKDPNAPPLIESSPSVRQGRARTHALEIKDVSSDTAPRRTHALEIKDASSDTAPSLAQALEIKDVSSNTAPSLA